MIEMRLRTRVADRAMEDLVGKVLGPCDYDVLLTGASRILMPSGRPLCVYLPGVLTEFSQDDEIYRVLASLKMRTNNRGFASGTRRIVRGAEGGQSKRTDSKSIISAVIGAVDPMGQKRYCRLTTWTGQNLPRWETLHPMLRAIAHNLEEHVPDRFAAQKAVADATKPEWVVTGTPFSTVTVNNCVDDRTECLTVEHGWTRYDQLQPGDRILAYDPVTNTTRWEAVESVYVNGAYAGPMVELSARGFSAFTTPDHRWPLQPPTYVRGERADHRIGVKVTAELPTSYWNIMRSAPHEGPAAATYSDAFVRLVAWYITEGTLTPSGTSISLCQSDRANPLNVEDIRRDLKALGAVSLEEWRNRTCDNGCDATVAARGLCQSCYNRSQRAARREGSAATRADYNNSRAGRSRREGLVVNEYRDRNRPEIVRWVVTGAGVQPVIDAAPGRDKIPTMEFLRALTPEQARMFVDTCITADGSPEFRRFYQHHPGRMGAYMAACVLAGYAPTLDATATLCYLRQPRSDQPNARVAVKTVRRRGQQYEGVVWCPRVPSGHWVARRAGTVYLTGNSYPTGVHTDKGDLDEGFSTIACVRRGSYTGGQLVFPQYRVAVDLRDGDLILMDAHQWHGNVAIVCQCGKRLDQPCKECGGERISVVSYYRTKMKECGTSEEELARAAAVAERRSGMKKG